MYRETFSRKVLQKYLLIRKMEKSIKIAKRYNKKEMLYFIDLISTVIQLKCFCVFPDIPSP